MDNFVVCNICLEIMETLLFYSLFCRCLCVSYFGAFPVFPVFCPIPAFYAKSPNFYAKILRYLGLLFATGGGVPWVAWRHPWTRAYFYLGVQFNVPTWFLITDLNLAPVPTGDWRSELCGSFTGRILQRRLRFFYLIAPVLAKGFLPLSIPWIESIESAWPGLPYLSLYPLREQTTIFIRVYSLM